MAKEKRTPEQQKAYTRAYYIRNTLLKRDDLPEERVSELLVELNELDFITGQGMTPASANVPGWHKENYQGGTIKEETDEEIDAKLRTRFEVLDGLCRAAIHNDSCRSLIVSGPAGLGKSFTVETALYDWDPNERNHSIIKGFIRMTGLYKMLWDHKEAGQVVVFDDCDSVFLDEGCLNMLKAACDTTERRRITYAAETNFVDENGDIIPRQFDFNGTVIFITNHDFDYSIDKGMKLANHFEALVSRSHYIDLAMKTRRDYLIRIRQVVADGLLDKWAPEIQHDVMSFIENNQDNLRELSLRIALKLAGLREMDANQFDDLAKITCCRGVG